MMIYCWTKILLAFTHESNTFLLRMNSKTLFKPMDEKLPNLPFPWDLGRCGPIIINSTRLIQHTHTHTQAFYCSSGICLGTPGWAGTRKVKSGFKPIWIYWSKLRWWVSVASAGLYASLHLIPDNHVNIPPPISSNHKFNFTTPFIFL